LFFFGDNSTLKAKNQYIKITLFFLLIFFLLVFYDGLLVFLKAVAEVVTFIILGDKITVRNAVPKAAAADIRKISIPKDVRKG
jgi:hypothetical protein